MKYDTSELYDICDEEEVHVVDPLFSNFGARTSFGGRVVTVKCYEDNGLLFEFFQKDGHGRVLVIDGGGSIRRALIDAELAKLAIHNEWEGMIVYGAVCQVDKLAKLDIGIQATATVPARATDNGIGEIYTQIKFGGVTFFTDDHVYADNTGIILSESPLNFENPSDIEQN